MRSNALRYTFENDNSILNIFKIKKKLSQGEPCVYNIIYKRENPITRCLCATREREIVDIDVLRFICKYECYIDMVIPEKKNLVMRESVLAKKKYFR